MLIIPLILSLLVNVALLIRLRDRQKLLAAAVAAYQRALVQIDVGVHAPLSIEE